MSKILITPQGFYFVKSKIEEFFNKKHEYIFSGGMIDNKEKLIDLMADCRFAIVGSENIDHEVIDAAKNLELIVRFGTSTENIDKDYLDKKNIKLFTIKSPHTIDGVARLCSSFALSYIFNVNKHMYDSSKGLWKRYMNLDPANISIGLIGGGDIASRFYDFGSSLGFNFNYHSRKEKIQFSNNDINFFNEIQDLIKASHIISIHLPYNKETQNLISQDELSLFENKMLINTSRAGIICKEALFNSLNNLSNFYYFTDVLHTEPPTQDDINLMKHKNVFSTAHIGGYSESALIDVALKSLKIIENEI